MRFVLPLFLCSLASAQDKDYDRRVDLNFDPGPSPALSPEEELETFEIVDGFRIELVASDPMIEDPVGIRWDEDGRLWVLEMRGFMLDINSTGDKEPSGRVSILEDTDGDGRMDKSTVFLDGLVLPRALCITRGGALIAEHEKLWFARDTDGDLVADEQLLVDPEYATSGSVEHRANGLLMAIDNWIYNARSNKRYRFVDGKWIWEEIQSRGQWGICQDDWGRLFYNFNWSQLHCDLAPPRTLTRNPNHTPSIGVNHALTQDLRVWPIRMNTAVNRAYRPGILDEKGRLREFASACSPWIYRGGQFPAAFHGNAFVCAPGANLVKRLIVEDGLYPTAKNAYEGFEFLASTDERFRPVALEGGPDGGLYIVDMYRGVIQQGEFMTEHLRRESLKRDLVEPVHLGRIWRVVAEDREQPKPPKMSELSDQQLLTQLESPNGWVRDTAQRLLIEREAMELAPDLLKIVETGETPQSQVQALWTLQGLGYRWPEFVIDETSGSIVVDEFPEMLFDGKHPKVQTAMLRTIASHELSTPVHRPLFDYLLFEQPDLRWRFSAAVSNKPGRYVAPILEFLANEHGTEPLIREVILSGSDGIEIELITLILGEYWHLFGSEPKNGEEPASWRAKQAGVDLVVEGLAASHARSDAPRLKALELLAREHESGFGEAIRRGIASANPAAAKADHRDFTPAEQKAHVAGRQLYAGLCAACHGANGEGLKPLAPPLAGSEWVSGSIDRLGRILFQGMEGPVNVAGKNYAPPDILPAMPPLRSMKDTDLAKILSYIRLEFGGAEGVVDPKELRRIRDTTTDRFEPWTEAELKQIP